MTLQTSKDIVYQANLRATVSAKCSIAHHGYCTIVSGAVYEITVYVVQMLIASSKATRSPA